MASHPQGSMPFEPVRQGGWVVSFGEESQFATDTLGGSRAPRSHSSVLNRQISGNNTVSSILRR